MEWYARFDSKYEQSDGCWEWQASRTYQGYGNFRLNGRMHGAHRAAYMRHIGPIPDGMHVLHTCDNPPCVNPAHLSLGTNADNVADRQAKGRGRRGPVKTHCKRGHPLSGDNVKWRANAYGGWRECRACRRMRVIDKDTTEGPDPTLWEDAS